ncbi:hypothetical protein JKP88DRAFT_329974 [Tribonema minus]|uniref:Uncharacterized protein n=1 Tax=Tribonema minus TaxID=303371 RepID=A0A836CAT8_9STRA|nr:hypothetical protein JKP88DRAFT_329974 [Tribonema minus]
MGMPRKRVGEKTRKIDAVATGGKLSWNTDVTFYFMMHRRLLRKLQGTYRRDMTYERWAKRGLYMVAFLCALVLVTETSDIGPKIGYIVLLLAVMWVFDKLFSYLSVAVLWFYLAWFAIFCKTGQLSAIVRGRTQGADTEFRNDALLAAAVMCLVSVVASVARIHFYPYAVQNQKLGRRWFGVRAADSPDTLQYLSWPRRMLLKLPKWVRRLGKLPDATRWRKVSYTGGLDENGRPHGAGQWTETGPHGEILLGWWHHGVPAAPFRSLESDTGYAFHAMRVVAATCRPEDEGLEGMDTFPSHRPNGFGYMVLSTECSVSGMFFRHLPEITTQVAPSPSAPGALYCVSRLVSPIDGILNKKHYPMGGIRFVGAGWDADYKVETAAPVHGGTAEAESATAKALSAEAETLRGELRAKININCAMARSGKSHRQLAKMLPLSAPEDAEALIFIHGFATTTAFAIKAIAQMFSLGDFPPYIFPFVFSWPGGMVLTYQLARDRAATNPRTHADLIQLLQDIRAAGIRKVSIMTHSMGARVLMGTCWRFDEVFATIDSAKDTGVDTSGLLQLQTVTCLNPDFEMIKFTKPGGTFDQISRFCSVMTVYADAKDGALLAGSIVMTVYADAKDGALLAGSIMNWADSLGRQIHGLKRPEPAAAPTEDQSPAADNSASVVKEEAKSIAIDTIAMEEGTAAATATPPPSARSSTTLAAALQAGGGGSGSGADFGTSVGLDVTGSPMASTAAASAMAQTSRRRRETDVGAMKRLNRALLSGSSAQHVRRMKGLNRALLGGGGGSGARVVGMPSGKSFGGASITQPSVATALGDEVQALQMSGGSVGVTLASMTGEKARDEVEVVAEYMEEDEEEEAEDWLDMDVIDTTWLENNIHSMRHSFFNINPTIVDDLRELIVHHRRAEDRVQVTHKFNNVFSFMVAPNSVKNP